MQELKDNIDFGRENISKLFRKMLYPTLLGMLFSAVFIITDGIFVGHGLGSDALAAINIVAPLFLFSTGIGLMFGMGASIVASIHLSTGKEKAKICIKKVSVVYLYNSFKGRTLTLRTVTYYLRVHLHCLYL